MLTLSLPLIRSFLSVPKRLVVFSLTALLLLPSCTLGDQASAPAPGSSDPPTASPDVASLPQPSPETEAAPQLDPAEVDLSSAIDQFVAETLVENGPGVAVLVMEDGEILHAEGYGFSDVEQKVPITDHTVFDLASVSKQMTAMGILMLMEEGELDLDDPVIDYVTDFVDPDPDNPILISDLLSHISGLADYSEDWEGTDEEFARLTLDDHLQWLNQQDVYDDRGVGFYYNNSGYALLALLIQRVSEQPFPEFMKEYIFEPLGMEDTAVVTQLDQTFPNQAKGYVVSAQGKVAPSSFPMIMTGDGNVFSSIADLAKYDNALRDEELVDAESLELAFTTGELDDGSPVIDEDTEEEYGLGWEIDDDYVDHSGSWDGTSTYYRHYTDEPVTIVVLSNDENYDAEELTDQIAEVLDL